MVLDPADHDTWSGGSFFTNPILAAEDMAALADRVRDRLGEGAPRPAGVARGGRPPEDQRGVAHRGGRVQQGIRLTGPVALSDKHTLAVTNRGEARTADVVALARQIQAGVEAAFGVRLVNEPVLMGVRL